MASITSNKFRALLLKADIDVETDTIKVMLVTSAYTPNKDHNFVDSITGGTSKELSGTGYTAGFGGGGRKALASKTVTQDDTNDVAYFDAADLTWSAINAGTAQYAVLIKEVTSDADSPIIATIDVGPLATSGGDLTLQWAAGGLFNLAAA